MIRITKQADYGIILLSQFVTGSGNVSCAARDLAEQSRIPVPMVGKILKMLVRKGLLESHRGVKGGYSLARPPEKISVAEIVTALDGPIGLTLCSVHTGDCDLEAECPSRSNWHRINLAILGTLRRISLADMARPGFSFQRADDVRAEAPVAVGSGSSRTRADKGRSPAEETI